MRSFFIFFIAVALFSMGCSQTSTAQQSTVPDIGSVKLYTRNDQAAMPIIRLGVPGQLELQFDDFSTRSRTYAYTYVLCNADWTPAQMSQMDYMTGFTQNRINQYRFSSVAFSKYVHYQALLPEQNCMPNKAGNYLLKVYVNGDTSARAFERRIMIVDEKLAVAAQVLQPFAGEHFRTHQKIAVRVNAPNVDIFNPQQQLKVVVLQNYRWDNAQTAFVPNFIRGREYEYNAEDNLVFEGGKEWRWLDLRSFRLQSDRVRSIDYAQKPYSVQVNIDTSRARFRTVFYRDRNGRYFVETLENINPWNQGDYAKVNFTFLPNADEDFSDKHIFVTGELTNYSLNPAHAMVWNEALKAYQTTLLLKNGFYNYAYITAPRNGKAAPSFALTEGNSWDTENIYTVLVYYRPFGARHDELAGVAEINSFTFLNRGR